MTDSTADGEPFDPGLQPERTLLAWQRTVLALGVGCAVAMRLTAPYLGVPAVVAGITGLVLATIAYLGVRFRYRRTHAALTGSATLHSVSAWPLVALAGSALTLGLIAALAVGRGL